MGLSPDGNLSPVHPVVRAARPRWQSAQAHTVVVPGELEPRRPPKVTGREDEGPKDRLTLRRRARRQVEHDDAVLSSTATDSLRFFSAKSLTAVLALSRRAGPFPSPVPPGPGGAGGPRCCSGRLLRPPAIHGQGDGQLRASAVAARHGRIVQVELDALPPDVLRALFTDALAPFVDRSRFAAVVARENAERTALAVLHHICTTSEAQSAVTVGNYGQAVKAPHQHLCQFAQVDRTPDDDVWEIMVNSPDATFNEP